MQVILLSGGSGKRLWPLSNDSRSKQYLKLLEASDGSSESMVQRVYRQIREAGIDAEITVAASESQKDSITSHLGHAVSCVWEPERRDTFPAIALACAYLHSEKECSYDEIVVILPVDPYTEGEYFNTILKMVAAVQDGAEMALMGIEPTCPSSKYGYIVPKPAQTEPPYLIESFTEKPAEFVASELLKAGAKWNGGVFAFKLGYLVNKANRYVDEISYKNLYENYQRLPKISFDYEVVEKAKSVVMIPFGGIWKDLGTWNTLGEVMPKPVVGNAVIGEGTQNTCVINELQMPLIVLGIKDSVIAASPDGILVTTKDASAKLKPYVDRIGENSVQRAMYEERCWGTYTVIDYRKYEDNVYSLTKHLSIKAGQSISYQNHNRRNEIWAIVDGTGELLIDGHVRNVGRGDVAHITVGMKPAIRAVSDLRLIEVQIGERLEVDDIERIDWAW